MKQYNENNEVDGDISNDNVGGKISGKDGDEGKQVLMCIKQEEGQFSSLQNREAKI